MEVENNKNGVVALLRSKLRLSLSMLIATIAMALIAGFSLFLYSDPASAHDKPAALWNPQSLDVTLSPGESQEIAVTFTASDNARNVAVLVSPEIAPYVSAQSNTIDRLRKGKATTLVLYVNIPSDVLPTNVSGSIKLRTSKKRGREFDVFKRDNEERHEKEHRDGHVTTIAEPLPVNVNVVWPTLDNSENGISITYPPSWFVEADDQSVVVRNTPEHPEYRNDNAYFEVRRLVNANPTELAINEWFDAYFSLGFPQGVVVKEFITILNQEAIRIEAVDVGTEANTYIRDGTDIIVVTYELDEPQFTADYEAMLQSLVLTD